MPTGLYCQNTEEPRRFSGAFTMVWAKRAVTTMLMDAGMDTGPMLIEKTIPVGLTDNAWDVASRLSALSADLLATTLQKRQQQMIRPVPQNNEQATYAPLIAKSDYGLDWTLTAKALHNKIRGFYPNCVTQFRENALKISESFPLGELYWSQLPDELAEVKSLYLSTELLARASPGTIVAVLKNWGPVIQTGEGHLLLREVKPAGKRFAHWLGFCQRQSADGGRTSGQASTAG